MIGAFGNLIETILKGLLKQDCPNLISRVPACGQTWRTSWRQGGKLMHVKRLRLHFAKLCRGSETPLTGRYGLWFFCPSKQRWRADMRLEQQYLDQAAHILPSGKYCFSACTGDSNLCTRLTMEYRIEVIWCTSMSKVHSKPENV